ncbi:MAG: nucleotide exchange factor GrpE [Verrucomicrobiia bacterium]
MTDSAAPKLSKWPFVLGDVILVAFGALVVFRTTGPLNAWQFFGALAAIAAGAWLCILPFLREHRAAIKLAEALALADAVTQMQNLQRIQTQIGGATDQWQAIHEMAKQASGDAKQVANQMKAQLDEFCAFLAKARDAEKDHLKLEVEKLRRAERDWLQAAVIVLDHIFALHTAAVRAGQPGMVAQLSQFQMACRDAMRRLGLNGFAPAAADAFNPQLHQLEDGAGSPDGALRVKEVLALGYTFQGELVRRALVRAEEAAASP